MDTWFHPWRTLSRHPLPFTIQPARRSSSIATQGLKFYPDLNMRSISFLPALSLALSSVTAVALPQPNIDLTIHIKAGLRHDHDLHLYSQYRDRIYLLTRPRKGRHSMSSSSTTHTSNDSAKQTTKTKFTPPQITVFQPWPS